MTSGTHAHNTRKHREPSIESGPSSTILAHRVSACPRHKFCREAAQISFPTILRQITAQISTFCSHSPKYRNIIPIFGALLPPKYRFDYRNNCALGNLRAERRRQNISYAIDLGATDSLRGFAEDSRLSRGCFAVFRGVSRVSRGSFTLGESVKQDVSQCFTGSFTEDSHCESVQRTHCA